jgi:hypothetical protein
VIKYKTRVVPHPDSPELWQGQCACEFTTGPWPTKKLTQVRLDEHTDEHDSGEPMRELVEFQVEHGLAGPVVDPGAFTDEGA